MPEAQVANAGDLAALLKEGGYQIPGDSPNLELLGKLPKNVKARVSALKQNQLDAVQVEAKFYQRVHELEKEFEKQFNVVYEQRRKIVSGEYEPKPEECTLPLIDGAEKEEIDALNEKSAEDAGEKGVPDFWLTVLKSCSDVSDMIQECDEPILKHLIDLSAAIESDPSGFTLYFHFSENPYFKNAVLKKRYFLNLAIDEKAPFEYDGPAVEKSEGDKIDWLDGKDVTKKVIKKKQKKGANAGKFLTKTVKADSFFNFFDPPAPCDADHTNEDDDGHDDELLQADLELGPIFRDHIIPRAVLFFTGEAAEDDFDYGDDEEEGDDDEDGGEESD